MHIYHGMCPRTHALSEKHARTPTAQVRNADIVVSAAGRAGLVKGHWIRPGAVVVDVAMNTQGNDL